MSSLYKKFTAPYKINLTRSYNGRQLQRNIVRFIEFSTYENCLMCIHQQYDKILPNRKYKYDNHFNLYIKVKVPDTFECKSDISKENAKPTVYTSNNADPITSSSNQPVPNNVSENSDNDSDDISFILVRYGMSLQSIGNKFYNCITLKKSNCNKVQYRNWTISYDEIKCQSTEEPLSYKDYMLFCSGEYWYLDNGLILNGTHALFNNLSRVSSILIYLELLSKELPAFGTPGFNASGLPGGDLFAQFLRNNVQFTQPPTYPANMSIGNALSNIVLPHLQIPHQLNGAQSTSAPLPGYVTQPYSNGNQVCQIRTTVPFNFITQQQINLQPLVPIPPPNVPNNNLQPDTAAAAPLIDFGDTTTATTAPVTTTTETVATASSNETTQVQTFTTPQVPPAAAAVPITTPSCLDTTSAQAKCFNALKERTYQSIIPSVDWLEKTDKELKNCNITSFLPIY